MTGDGVRLAPSPDDLAAPGLSPDDCFIFGDECEFSVQHAVQHADRPRATAMSLFAEEMGVDFKDVSCRVGYLRFFTRQEAYEAREVDYGEVPDDWGPGEDDSVWEFCAKDAPGAIRCWRLELR